MQPVFGVLTDVSGLEISAYKNHSAGPSPSTTNSNITEDANTMLHVSIESGISYTLTIKHYEDTMPYSLRELFIPPSDKRA
ncbi:hypothetical protein CU097_002748, partial [Rhizopus azygosporus]